VIREDSSVWERKQEVEDDQSVTRWISAVRRGEDEAAHRLWQRYFEQLLRQARRRMATLPRTTYNEEDAALSTFEVLCTKLREGCYPNLSDRDELWQLMLTVLARKIGRRADYEYAEKRDSVRTSGNYEQAVCVAAAPSWASQQAVVECQELLDLLGDENLVRVALWKLEGYTHDEIARKLNRTRRTVQRMLELIRDTWKVAADDCHG
jgi:DNA-directed RNA polymerase specialized sigma24 family protein